MIKLSKGKKTGNETEWIELNFIFYPFGCNQKNESTEYILDTEILEAHKTFYWICHLS